MFFSVNEYKGTLPSEACELPLHGQLHRRRQGDDDAVPNKHTHIHSLM